jgi:hypothetical protein
VGAAGYLLWISTHCTLSPLLWRPRSVEYWIALTNILGSWGFFIAGACTRPVLHGPLALTFVQVCALLFLYPYPYPCSRGKESRSHGHGFSKTDLVDSQTKLAP